MLGSSAAGDSVTDSTPVRAVTRHFRRRIFEPDIERPIGAVGLRPSAGERVADRRQPEHHGTGAGIDVPEHPIAQVARPTQPRAHLRRRLRPGLGRR